MREQILLAEQKNFASEMKSSLTLAAQEEAYKNVRQIQEEINNQRDQVDRLAFAITDSDEFIDGLQQKLNALNDASAVAEYLIEVEFDSCPACFAPLQPSESTDSCHLCKTPFDSQYIKERMVALINESALQLRQSRLLQQRRRKELEKAQTDLDVLGKIGACNQSIWQQFEVYHRANFKMSCGNYIGKQVIWSGK